MISRRLKNDTFQRLEHQSKELVLKKDLKMIIQVKALRLGAFIYAA